MFSDLCTGITIGKEVRMYLYSMCAVMFIVHCEVVCISCTYCMFTCSTKL